jgi:hypothetical protein
MDYSKINVDEEVAKVDLAMEQGNYRFATTKESMVIRLAALGEIVRNMQEIVEKDVEKDKQLVNA